MNLTIWGLGLLESRPSLEGRAQRSQYKNRCNGNILKDMVGGCMINSCHNVAFVVEVASALYLL